VLANNSNARPGVTKTGNDYGGQQIKVLLSEVFGASYNNYLAAEDNIRIVLQYYGSGSGKLADLDIQEAYLLISSVPVVGNTSAPGLMTAFGLGDTTIRNSANEYGWKFGTKDNAGKLPKGIGDVAALRAADYFFFVSKDGGVSAGNGVATLAGYEQISIILEAGGNSYETKITDDLLLYPHADESVYFVVTLADLNGYTNTLGATVTQKDLDDTKPPAGLGGYSLGSPKWKNVNLIVKYASAFENLGLLAGYIYEDNATTDFDTLLNDSSTGIANGKLEYNYIGVTPKKEFGVITNNTDFKVFMRDEGLPLPALYPTMEEKKGAFGDFTKKTSDTEYIWGFSGVDGALDFNLVKNATYLVLETKGTKDEFGGMRIVHQSSGDSFGWNSTNPWGDTVAFPHAATDTVYIVFELATLTNWASAMGDASVTSGKFIIQSWPMSALGITDAYLIPTASASGFAKANFSDALDTDPEKPATLEFFITKDPSFTTKLGTLFGW
jgi:hypothetical protein